MNNKYVENLQKSFDDILVLDSISIEFQKGKITCILGPSGCGKSTLLNILTGLIKDYKGQILGFDEEDISFIFQEDRLIPWLTVYENIELVLKRKYSQEERERRIKKYLKLVKMDDYIDFYPSDLSGGMKQRISIARALAYGGQVIIMDEPFKSLDIKNKTQLLKDFKNIASKSKATVIFVTHDIDEAIEIGDIIYVLSDKPTRVKKVWTNLRQDNLRKEILAEII